MYLISKINHSITKERTIILTPTYSCSKTEKSESGTVDEHGSRTSDGLFMVGSSNVRPGVSYSPFYSIAQRLLCMLSPRLVGNKNYPINTFYLHYTLSWISAICKHFDVFHATRTLSYKAKPTKWEITTTAEAPPHYAVWLYMKTYESPSSYFCSILGPYLNRVESWDKRLCIVCPCRHSRMHVLKHFNI